MTWSCTQTFCSSCRFGGCSSRGGPPEAPVIPCLLHVQVGDEHHCGLHRDAPWAKRMSSITLACSASSFPALIPSHIDKSFRRSRSLLIPPSLQNATRHLSQATPITSISKDSLVFWNFLSIFAPTCKVYQQLLKSISLVTFPASRGRQGSSAHSPGRCASALWPGSRTASRLASCSLYSLMKRASSMWATTLVNCLSWCNFWCFIWELYCGEILAIQGVGMDGSWEFQRDCTASVGQFWKYIFFEQ